MHFNRISKLSVLLFKGNTSGVSCRPLVVSYPHSCRYHVHILFREWIAWSPIPPIGIRASRLARGRNRGMNTTVEPLQGLINSEEFQMNDDLQKKREAIKKQIIDFSHSTKATLIFSLTILVCGAGAVITLFLGDAYDFLNLWFCCPVYMDGSFTVVSLSKGVSGVSLHPLVPPFRSVPQHRDLNIADNASGKIKGQSLDYFQFSGYN